VHPTKDPFAVKRKKRAMKKRWNQNNDMNRSRQEIDSVFFIEKKDQM